MEIGIPWQGVVDQINAFMTSDLIANGISWLIGLSIAGFAIFTLRWALTR
jgi:hypothetical protein